MTSVSPSFVRQQHERSDRFGRTCHERSDALTVSEPADLIDVATPVLLHLDLQVEIDLGTQQHFEIRARFGANVLDGSATFAHEDALLRIALDIDGRIDAREMFTAVITHLFDHHPDRMRNFVIDREEDLLADEFRTITSCGWSVSMSAGNQSGPSGR